MHSPLPFAAIFLGSAMVASAKLKPAAFLRMDADEDGFLDPGEFVGSKQGSALKKALKSFAKLDVDDDSLVSAVEALGTKAAETAGLGATASISSTWASLDLIAAAGYVSSIGAPGERDPIAAGWLAAWDEFTTRPPADVDSPRPPRE